MIHFVLHDANDSVAVVVVEGVKAGMELSGWIMDEDRMTRVTAKQDIPIGHKVALRDMAAGDTVIKYGIDMGKVVKPIRAGEHGRVQDSRAGQECTRERGTWRSPSKTPPSSATGARTAASACATT
mgnify:CR=1 FL=1